MKKIKFLSVALLSGMFVLTSCDNENDNFGPGGINSEIYAEFARLYPGAKDVEWDTTNGTYAVASFEWSGSRAGSDADNKAWFELASSKFVMDEHDIPFASLPEKVKAAFNESKYSTWKEDDEVDVIRRVDKGLEPFYLYVIEAEKGKEHEVDLYYSADGVLVKEIMDASNDNDFTDLLPSKPTETKTVEEFIANKYKGARIVDLDNEDGGIEVEFIHNNLKHEALFTLDNKWVYTKIDYNRDINRLPDSAKQHINSKHPDGYHEIDIEFYDCAESSKNYYNVEIEDRNDRDYEYNFDINGELLNEVPNFTEDMGGGMPVDAAIQNVLDKKYPGAVVLERDYDDGLLELEIRHEDIEKSVYFNGRNEWVYTEYDILYTNISPTIKDYINKYYSNYRPDNEVEVRETSNGLTYEVELDGAGELKVSFDEDGNFKKEIHD